MKAMLLDRTALIEKDSAPLRYSEVDLPHPGDDEVLTKVTACGVCHTELDEIEGRTPPRRFPMILGHQVVGKIVATGDDVHHWQPGDRVGVAWIGYVCGECPFCLSGRENLCPEFQATGRDRNGGYAQYMTARSESVFAIPTNYSDAQVAPLLCAGAIGYRSLRLTNLRDGQSLGLMGYGASAQRVLEMARHRFPNSLFFVFARDEGTRALALEHGANWVGATAARAPQPLDAIIDTTPAWSPVIAALENLSPGGRLVINAIRKEEGDKESLLRLDYSRHLWMEKDVKTVANVAHSDVSEFLKLAGELSFKSPIQEYPLVDANRALVELKYLPVVGAKVLLVD